MNTITGESLLNDFGPERDSVLPQRLTVPVQAGNMQLGAWHIIK